MRDDPQLKVQWNRILNKQSDLQRKTRDYFRLVIGRRKPVYCSHTMIFGCSDELVDMAKRILFEQSYLPTKVLLKHFAGVRLGVPTWEIKADNITTVAWKAYADRHPSNEAQRRMRLAHKRAMRLM
jgi:hypothetical protein